jgi:hypothetical protein
MPGTNTVITRNLRNGQLVLADGSGTPKTMTVLFVDGGLKWTERLATLVVRDRGSLNHSVKGDDQEVDVSFDSMWTQLISKSVSAGNTSVLYEFVNFLITGMTSTCGAGQQDALSWQFTISDPSGNGNSELVTFAKVYKDSLTCTEGHDGNRFSMSGRDMEKKPTVTRTGS